MMVAAQKEPEKYKDLLVRIAGYSAYFVELSTELQNDLIGRTELSFDCLLYTSKGLMTAVSELDAEI